MSTRRYRLARFLSALALNITTATVLSMYIDLLYAILTGFAVGFLAYPTFDLASKQYNRLRFKRFLADDSRRDDVVRGLE